MGVGKNAPVLRQGFSITSAAKIRRKAVLERIFLQCGNKPTPPCTASQPDAIM